MVLTRDSWKILDDGVTAIKRTDKSVFDSNGSGIPVDIRPFFDLETMEPRGHRNITLCLRGVEYAAYLERKGPKPSGKQTQIHWHADLKKVINEMFPRVVESKSYPDMIFHKIDSVTYRIEFIGGIIETGSLFIEDGSLETVVEGFVEGRKIQFFTSKYERNRDNREMAIRYNRLRNQDGLRCQVCGFSFEETYGSLGSGFIEVHHIKPLYSLDEEMVVDPETDLVCLCSNCHRMIHRRRGEIVQLDELKKIIEICRSSSSESSDESKDGSNPSSQDVQQEASGSRTSIQHFVPKDVESIMVRSNSREADSLNEVRTTN